MFKKIMLMFFVYCLAFCLPVQAEDDVLLPGDTQMPTVRHRAAAPTLQRVVKVKRVHARPAHRIKKPHQTRSIKRAVQYRHHRHHSKSRLHYSKLNQPHIKKYKLARGHAKKSQRVLLRHKKVQHFKIKHHGHR